MHTMNIFRSTPMLLLAMGLSLAACKKEEAATPATPPTGGGGGGSSAPNTTPNFSDADASLWAVRSFNTQSTPIGPMDITIGTGVAVFSNDNFSTFVNVGDVALNGTALTRQSNNSYVLQPSQTNPTGIDLGGNIAWTVQGGGGFDGFNRDITSLPFPTVQPINSSTTVVRANGYTLTTTQVTQADSVLFFIGNVSKTLAGNATSCTFTSAELAGVAAGSSIAMIVPYRYTSENIGGKTIYFGKEAVRSTSITVQ